MSSPSRPHRPALRRRTHRPGPRAALAGLTSGLTTGLLAAGLAACGGGSGGGDPAQAGLVSTAEAHGHAADTLAAPTASFAAAETALLVLEAGLAGTAAAADGQARALVATSAPDGGGGAASHAGTAPAELAQAAPAGAGTAPWPCPGGGTAQWSVAGGTPRQFVNGQLDAGELYTVHFTACTAAAGTATLDGELTLTVLAADGRRTQLRLAAAALRLARGTSSWQLDGLVQWARTVEPVTSGGSTTTSDVSAERLAVAVKAAGRDASYTLGDWTWQAVRSADAAGSPLSQTQQGRFALSVVTTRRPALTLQVATQSAWALAADGSVQSGQWVLQAPAFTLSATLAAPSVQLQLDQGSDGTVDRSWAVERREFESAAA